MEKTDYEQRNFSLVLTTVSVYDHILVYYARREELHMHAFAQKQNVALRTASVNKNAARSGSARFGQGCKMGPTATAPSRSGHDLSQIPVWPGGARAASLGEGGPDGVEMEGTRKTSEAEYPADFVGPLRPGDTRAVPADFVGPLLPGIARSASFHPTMTVVTPGTSQSDCGDYTYKVKWGIPATESSASGWIVQKVNKKVEVTDCNDKPVQLTAADDPAGYPFWEAWEFTAGQNVWVGPAAAGSPHSGDTFSGAGYGDGTKGKKTITGEVKAIIGFKLPDGMTPRNAAPAWALPYTRSEPAQFAGTLAGASHTLTSEWNCCPPGTVTKSTTVTTNP